MALKAKELKESKRNEYIDKIADLLSNCDEPDEVLRVASNQIALPVVLDDGSEEFIVITLKIPSGQRVSGGGSIPYDGYQEAIGYEAEVKIKAEKKAAREEAKQKKIARDKARREQEGKRAESKQRYYQVRGN